MFRFEWDANKPVFRHAEYSEFVKSIFIGHLDLKSLRQS